ncbi:other/AgaK1 protein kinase [Coprinopsis sp. MPI-PUGE-AT-0042]|nr:other/AgaK1 protein kinase [Coprinopsis sp. MPI-PUGE-AT-0042]
MKKPDSDLEIPFLFPDQLVEGGKGSFDEYEQIAWKRREFWTQASTLDWFKAQGFILYKSESDSWTEFESPLPQLPDPDFVEAAYPYPFHSSFTPTGEFCRKPRDLPNGAGCYAQDVLGHHVLIKMVPADSDELRIYELLHRASLEVTREHCVISVLDILTLKQFSFVVIPRWGSAPFRPSPQTLGEAASFMEAMLKGLAFLHRNRIAHRDMSFANVLVNHFSCVWWDITSAERRELRKAGRLSYAVMDFNLSIIVPNNKDLSKFRLPYQYAYDGRAPQPFDIAQGEHEYDPFAYDVGTLGAHLARSFQHLCADLPFLAPLFDMMTARQTARRFSAQFSLEFFQAGLSNTPPATLLRPFRSEAPQDLFYLYNRWKHVPNELAETWAVYREPPVSRFVKMARWICSFRYPAVFVRALRRFFAKCTCFVLWRISR